MATSEFVQELKTKISKYLNDPKYSDLTVTCGDSVFKVHRIVCCSQSKFFEACCDANMKEKEERTISLPEDDPEIVEAMLHYFYHFEYDIEPPREDADKNAVTPTIAPLLFHAQVYAIAEKYDIAGLMSLARVKFEAVARVEWFTEGFEQAIRFIYPNIPSHDSGLRGVVEDIVWNNMKELGRPGGMLELLSTEMWEFEQDLVTALARKEIARRNNLARQVCCHNCGKNFCFIETRDGRCPGCQYAWNRWSVEVI